MMNYMTEAERQTALEVIEQYREGSPDLLDLSTHALAMKLVEARARDVSSPFNPYHAAHQAAAIIGLRWAA